MDNVYDLELVRCLLRQKRHCVGGRGYIILSKDNAYQVRQLLLQLPIILIEVAHHVDSETVYNQVIDLGKYRIK